MTGNPHAISTIVSFLLADKPGVISRLSRRSLTS